MAHARVAVVGPQPAAAAVGVAVVGRGALVAVLLAGDQHVRQGPERVRRPQLAVKDGRGSHRPAVNPLICRAVQVHYACKHKSEHVAKVPHQVAGLHPDQVRH